MKKRKVNKIFVIFNRIELSIFTDSRDIYSEYCLHNLQFFSSSEGDV